MNGCSRRWEQSRLRPNFAENLLFLHHDMVKFELYEPEYAAATTRSDKKQYNFSFDRLKQDVNRGKGRMMSMFMSITE